MAPLLVAALLARTGRAEILLPGASLAVRNPPSIGSCVDEAMLGMKIRVQLSSRAAADSTLPALRLDIAIKRSLTALVADLRLSGRATGSRQIEAARCEGLTEALAVTIAMILDQDAAESSSVATTRAVPVAAVQTETPATPTPIAAAPATGESKQQPSIQPNTLSKSPATSASAASHGIRLGADHELRASLGGGFGSSGSWLLEAGSDYAYRHWVVQLGAFYQPKRQVALGAGQLELTTMGGAVAGCRRFGGEWRIVSCARMTLGAETVEGIGYDHPSSQRLLVGSLGPRLGVETGTRWVMGLDLVGQFAFWRDQYLVENTRETTKAPLFVAWLVARVALSSRAARARSE